MSVTGQCLLKRCSGTTREEFSEHYLERHGPIAMPWALSNNVVYYAQASVTLYTWKLVRLL